MMLSGIALVLLTLAGWYLYHIWQTSSAEHEIRKLMEIRATALNDKDLELYLSCFSPDYRGGTKTLTDLKADAHTWFSTFETIRFSCQLLDVHIQQDEALVENVCKVSVTTGEGTSQDMQPIRELFEVHRETGEWKIAKTLPIQ